MAVRLSALAERLGLTLQGQDKEIRGLAPLDKAGPEDLSFLANTKYAAALETTRAAAVIVDAAHAPRVATALVAQNPYLAMAQVAQLFAVPQGRFQGQSPLAYVHPAARVDASAVLAPFAFVGEGATVGPRSVLYPHVYVGEDVEIGPDCVLYPGVAVMARVRLGAGVILQPGAVIGGDGFGYALSPQGPVKVPQMGRVVLADGVEIGANTTVDRGSLGDTEIGPLAKIDNLVMLAHNVHVGAGSILVGQVGVSGSTHIGSGVMIAGQAGLTGHLHIGDRARIGAQSGIMQDVPAGAEVVGSPAMDGRKFFRMVAGQQRLPELLRRVSALEKELAALRQGAKQPGDSHED